MCGESLAPDPGYIGNSFWISEVHGRWFLGAWGGSIFRVDSCQRAIDFSIAWLTHECHKTLSQFSPDFISRFQLTRADDEFESLVSIDPPS